MYTLFYVKNLIKIVHIKNKLYGMLRNNNKKLFYNLVE